MPELVLAGVLLAGADATPREVTLLDLDALPGEAWASLQLEQAEAHLATLEAMRGKYQSQDGITLPFVEG